MLVIWPHVLDADALAADCRWVRMPPAAAGTGEWLNHYGFLFGNGAYLG
jgi:hypothetical protein